MTTYLDALNGYLKLKTRYIKRINNAKQKIIKSLDSDKVKRERIKALLPPCIKCNKRVGTVFEEYNRTYVARCGSEQDPCDLDIRIKKPNVINLDEQSGVFREKVEDNRLAIMKVKYDMLFNLVDEDIGLKQFEEIQTYFKSNDAAYSSIFEYITQVNNEALENRDKIRKLEAEFNMFKVEFKQAIRQYEETESRSAIKEAIYIYINKFRPILDQIRSLKCKYNEIETDPLDDSVQVYKCNPYNQDDLEYEVEKAKIISNKK
mgnify:FL=1